MEEKRNSDLGKMLWTNLLKAWARQNGVEIQSITFHEVKKAC